MGTEDRAQIPILSEPALASGHDVSRLADLDDPVDDLTFGRKYLWERFISISSVGGDAEN